MSGLKHGLEHGVHDADIHINSLFQLILVSIPTFTPGEHTTWARQTPIPNEITFKMDYTRTRTESMHYYSMPNTRPKTAEPLRVSTRLTTRPRAQTYENVSPIEKPWNHKAKTYDWVMEQEKFKTEKKNRKIEKWVVEQQEFLADRTNEDKKTTTKPQRRRTWDELASGCAKDGDKWMAQAAEARRAAIEKEKEKARVIEEDIKRIQARVQKKKESEKRRLAEERTRAAEAQKEKERQERVKAEVASNEIWQAYDDQWTKMTSSSGPLSFHTIPWPLVSHPSSTKDIFMGAIMAFLLSPLHSKTQTRKERIRTALLRWHPDRFQKILARVVEDDKEMVEAGVGIVARCLNELMERETRASRREFAKFVSP